MRRHAYSPLRFPLPWVAIVVVIVTVVLNLFLRAERCNADDGILVVKFVGYECITKAIIVAK